MSCAVRLREVGYEGRITLLTDEPRLPYDRCARQVSSQDAFADHRCRTHLSKEPVKGSNDPVQMLFMQDQVAQMSIEVRTDIYVEDIDFERQRVILEKDESLRYSELVLATGSRPKVRRGRASHLSLVALT